MEHIVDYSSSESDSEFETENIQNIREINIYSQNYAQQMNMSTVFMYLPWFPSLAMMNLMKKVSSRTLDHLKSKDPTFFNKYSWDLIGVPSKNIEGSFSITNPSLLRNYHITLHSNVRGDSRSISNFIENLGNGIADLKVPKQLLTGEVSGSTREENLKRLLFKQTERLKSPPSNKAIGLEFQNKISVFKSSTTKNLFISCAIKQTPQTIAFFKSLHTIIRENIELLGLVPYSMPPNGQEYHVSFIIAELKNVRLTQTSTQELEHYLSDLDISDLLKLIKVSVDSIAINQISDKRSSHTIKFKV